MRGSILLGINLIVQLVGRHRRGQLLFAGGDGSLRLAKHLLVVLLYGTFVLVLVDLHGNPVA